MKPPGYRHGQNGSDRSRCARRPRTRPKQRGAWRRRKASPSWARTGTYNVRKGTEDHGAAVTTGFGLYVVSPDLRSIHARTAERAATPQVRPTIRSPTIATRRKPSRLFDTAPSGSPSSSPTRAEHPGASSMDRTPIPRHNDQGAGAISLVQAGDYPLLRTERTPRGPDDPSHSHHEAATSTPCPARSSSSTTATATRDSVEQPVGTVSTKDCPRAGHDRADSRSTTATDPRENGGTAG